LCEVEIPQNKDKFREKLNPCGDVIQACVFQVGENWGANSSMNQVDNVVMNFASHYPFSIHLLQKKRHEKKSENIFDTKRKQQILNQIFGFQLLSSTSTPKKSFSVLLIISFGLRRWSISL